MIREFELRHNEVLRILALLSAEAAARKEELVFLGGSAVQATLENAKRVSIDLDVYYSGDTGQLVRFLEARGRGAEKYVVTRAKRGTVFDFYAVTLGKTLVKLDFLKIGIPDHHVTEKMLREPVGRGQFKVKMATPGYLAASKLAALAVGTVGRKEESESDQVDPVKDVFDFNCLVDGRAFQAGKLRAIVKEICEQQNAIRGTKYEVKEVYDSIRATLRRLAAIDPRREAPISGDALSTFDQHLMAGHLKRDELVTIALRTLCYTNAVEKGDDGGERADRAVEEKYADKRFGAECERRLAEAGEDAARIHHLRGLAPKAFLYLYYSRFPA